MLRDKLVNGEINKIAPLGRGGLIAKLAQLSSFVNIGIDVNIDVRQDLLFSEGASNYLVAAESGLNIEGAVEIGKMTGTQFKVKAQNFEINRELAEVKKAWEAAIPSCMNSED